MAGSEERFGGEDRLRLFVGEFITGGGCHGAALPPALAAEGAMMRDAALRDLFALGRFGITVPHDARTPAPVQAVAVRTITGDPWGAWHDCIERCDVALIVAPESDGVLERLNAMVLGLGKVLLGCEPAAVALTASKLATARRLAGQGIAVPATAWLGDGLPAGADGWVIKPDDGAGSEDTFFIEMPAALHHWEGNDTVKRPIVQAFVPGKALSLSVLYAGDEVVLLAVNVQHVSREQGRLRQTGVTVNGCPEQRPRMQALAEAIGRAVPGLRGYVGIDVIDTGEAVVVVEINPRLTTAYAGLAASLGCNPAALMLQALEGRAITASAVAEARPVHIDMK